MAVLAWSKHNVAYIKPTYREQDNYEAISYRAMIEWETKNINWVEYKKVLIKLQRPFPF